MTRMAADLLIGGEWMPITFFIKNEKWQIEK
jgi:hypothetical protein